MISTDNQSHSKQLSEENSGELENEKNEIKTERLVSEETSSKIIESSHQVTSNYDQMLEQQQSDIKDLLQALDDVAIEEDEQLEIVEPIRLDSSEVLDEMMVTTLLETLPCIDTFKQDLSSSTPSLNEERKPSSKTEIENIISPEVWLYSQDSSSDLKNENQIIDEKMGEKIDELQNKKQYPDDLNPFDDDEEETIQMDPLEKSNKLAIVISQKNYPDDLNPFDDDGEENLTVPLNTTSLNPFGSDDEESIEIEKLTIKVPPQPSPRLSIQHCIKPPSSIKKKKKRQAPLPPTNSSDQLNKQDTNLEDSVSINESIVSNTSTASAESEEPSFSSRTPTPTPRRNKATNSNLSASLASDMNSIGETSSSMTVNARLNAIKNKKRPAPPIPAFKRSLKMASIPEMDSELDELGNQLPLVESQRADLERWLLEKQERPTNDEIKIEYDTKLQKFLNLALTKCKLARKQKELMYMKREIKLEQTQLEIEYQLRIIMSKQDSQKSEEDQAEEQRLLGKMMEIVEERNDIIENMIQEENKEMDEYNLLIRKVLPPIRQNKSAGLSEKNKHQLTLSMLKLKKKKNQQGLASSQDSQDEHDQKKKKKKRDLATLSRNTLRKLNPNKLDFGSSKQSSN